MSYGVAAALQTAIYGLLVNDTKIAELVGPNVFDEAPAGAVPDLYVTLGPEVGLAAGDKTGQGARHRFTVSVVCGAAGFHGAKRIAGAVSDALDDARPELARGRVVGMQFLRADARRAGTQGKRRIDLRFEARVEDD
ncbi:DUF3168 domain-containing protein [Tropicimonas sp.]|uniref:DUF3168 domain-containing protein n=1 Tax=Tropicimonas sp. TaxID=2067044 RepID=UPI003A8B6DD3